MKVLRIPLSALLLGLLAGCATPPPPAACPAGQESLRTAQLFLGRKAPGSQTITAAQLQAFIDQEITPRFPDGLTVLDGGGQWQGAENRLIREAAKVVLIVLPANGDAAARVEKVRAAYKANFSQDSALLITQAACVAF